jgi:hypothetical protein
MISETALNDLRAAVSGGVLTPTDPGYDDVRRIHNGMFVRRPAVIARCLGTADIVDAIRFARAHDLELAMHCAPTWRTNRMRTTRPKTRPKVLPNTPTGRTTNGSSR